MIASQQREAQELDSRIVDRRPCVEEKIRRAVDVQKPDEDSRQQNLFTRSNEDKVGFLPLPPLMYALTDTLLRSLKCSRTLSTLFFPPSKL
jgi:hypothetical protein